MQGKGVSDGISIGILTIYRKTVKVQNVGAFGGTVAEISRLTGVREQACLQLEEARKNALEIGDNTKASLMNSYMVMINDPVFVDAIEDRIRTGRVPCEQALAFVRDKLCRLFSDMDDAYMRARAEDIDDLSNRLLQLLGGRFEMVNNLEEKGILLAEDLTPSETMQLDKSKILAFVTKRGSKLSHTAILARSLGIPAIVGIDYPEGCEGKLAIVDAYEGKLIIDPDRATLENYKAKKAALADRAKEFEKLVSLPCVTADGRKVGLFANVGGLDDIKVAVRNGCEAIGLFRTEFLYMNQDDYPSEEMQYNTYIEALDVLEGRELIIRTLDIGGDKKISYMDMKTEDNPAMGMRGIRYSLGHKDIFRTHLRAIYRAAAKGPIAVLLPMIISIEEIWQIKSIIYEVKTELDRQGIPYGECRLGAMIETPAAAVISDLLAREVDFFSIGTNDLTQYTLAVDRQNSELDFICDYHHQAVLRMLHMIVTNGHDNGCKVCVCGELAADTSFTQDLLRMGVDELSVSPEMLPRVKQAVREARIK
ncbi:MAG: phosphoenolpyruvate--protein phosphotransferase [Lachnospiraceae bacterium]|nr:phosphoenolpyruvate--protein phosphotransferase [Candidatus Colinaster scatohippi]